jgi:hypothetical protein
MFEWQQAIFAFNQFEKQAYHIERIKEWVATTVSPSYFGTCCNSETSLGDWYHNLKNQLDQTPDNNKDSPAGSEEKQNSQKRSRDDGPNSCRACTAPGHDLTDCFYVFPNKAAEGIQPNEQTQRLVDRIIELDSVLEEEIARINGNPAARKD